MLTDKFLSPKGDYKNLIAFRKSECIYDITLYFIEHYLPQIGDRTVDQMKQAARSGKQNIAEGNETGTTSMEACIKLVNVAKASLKELQEDYEDYLCNHGNQMWDVNSRQCRNARAWCKKHQRLPTICASASCATTSHWPTLHSCLSIRQISFSVGCWIGISRNSLRMAASRSKCRKPVATGEKSTEWDI